MSSRASAPRRSGRARQFVKDWKRLARSGRYPMQELKDVMQFLIENRGPLPPEFLDHPLKGAWIDLRDCYIQKCFRIGRPVAGNFRWRYRPWAVTGENWQRTFAADIKMAEAAARNAKTYIFVLGRGNAAGADGR